MNQTTQAAVLTLADELRRYAGTNSCKTPEESVWARTADALDSQAAAIREKDEALKAIADMRFNAETNHAELLALVLAIAKTAGGVP